ALIVLATVVAFFIVLDFLSRYFANYLRIILIFFFAWLLAFLISPVADWLQRRLTRLPRPVAVIAVLVPIILVTAFLIVRILASMVEALAALAAPLPGPGQTPPAILDDIQSWLDGLGIAVDVTQAFENFVHGALQGMVGILTGAIGGVVASVGT